MILINRFSAMGLLVIGWSFFARVQATLDAPAAVKAGAVFPR